ncbi:hypothetical protein CVT24_009872 [Panaeolus cyanescens]|uniref:Uncharacterized protein n=1 Tax=Panaeolus cyanescens TaxID=181874 RepID=A0A409VXS8_9AGAR|nr:hypothetical protein CVT24_009872 [Panaeolus cyanescens]
MKLLTILAVVVPFAAQANAWSCFCAPDDAAQEAVYPTYKCGENMSGVSYDNGGFFNLAHWYGLSDSQKLAYQQCCLDGGKDYHCY